MKSIFVLFHVVPSLSYEELVLNGINSETSDSEATIYLMSKFTSQTT
jgi:hypothetical protein